MHWEPEYLLLLVIGGGHLNLERIYGALAMKMLCDLDRPKLLNPHGLRQGPESSKNDFNTPEMSCKNQSAFRDSSGPMDEPRGQADVRTRRTQWLR